MSATAPLLQTIEADDPNLAPPAASGNIRSGNIGPAKPPVVLTPTNHSSNGMASSHSDAEAGPFSLS